MDRHVIEALGLARVVIEDGKVIEVGEPQVKVCPLFLKTRGITELNVDTIRKNIEFRIQDFGMCTPTRQMRMRDFLSYGISELIGMALSTELIDAAVLVCEGAGTVVVTEPELAQGIGGFHRESRSSGVRLRPFCRGSAPLAMTQPLFHPRRSLVATRSRSFHR
mgnify:CR=1 FL=1